MKIFRKLSEILYSILLYNISAGGSGPCGRREGRRGRCAVRREKVDTIARVEQLAAERGLSLHGLSELCSVPYTTIMNTKKRGGQLTVDTIERICRGLEIPLWRFFTDRSKV